MNVLILFEQCIQREFFPSLCDKVFNPQMAENHLYSHIEYVSTSGGTWLMCPKEVDFMGNFIGANIPFLCVPVCTNDHFFRNLSIVFNVLFTLDLFVHLLRKAKDPRILYQLLSTMVYCLFFALCYFMKKYYLLLGDPLCNSK